MLRKVSFSFELASFPAANSTACSQFNSCSNCVDTVGCEWCESGTNKNSCLLADTANQFCSSNNLFDQCNSSHNEAFVIAFICVLSALFILCCVTCFFRKSDNSFVERLPRQLALPASARAFLFRNSALTEGGKEWMCIICGFDNHPKYKACTMCGKGHKFTVDYKAHKKKIKEEIKQRNLQRKHKKNMLPAPGLAEKPKLDPNESKQHLELLTKGALSVHENPFLFNPSMSLRDRSTMNFLSVVQKPSFSDQSPKASFVSAAASTHISSDDSIAVGVEGYRKEKNGETNTAGFGDGGWTKIRESFKSLLNSQKKQEAVNYGLLSQLTLREKSARRRKIWRRIIDEDSTTGLKWIRVPIEQTRIGNSPFGYTPGNSLFFDAGLSYRPSISKSDGEVVNALMDANVGEVKTVAGAIPGSTIYRPSSTAWDSGGGGKISKRPSMDSRGMVSMYSYRNSFEDDLRDSFGDAAQVSNSPGFTSTFDPDGNLTWGQLDYLGTAPKSTLKLSNCNNENSAQKFSAQTKKYLNNNTNDLGNNRTNHEGSRGSILEMSPTQTFKPFGVGRGSSNISRSSITTSPKKESNALDTPLVDDVNCNETNYAYAKVQESLNKEFHFDLDAVASLPFKEKQIWFLDRMQEIQKPWSEGCVRLEIRRENILADSVGTFGVVVPNDLHKWLRIQFAGEPGIDAGGLEREWFELTVQQFLLQESGLFVCSSGEGFMGSYHINPLSGQYNQHHLRYFRLVGRMIGKGIMEQQPLAATLSLPLRKQILGTPVTFSDLEFVDSKLHESLLWLQKNDNVQSLCLDFTTSYEHMGRRLEFNLKAGGGDLNVDDDNKEEYLLLRLKNRLFDSIKEQLENLIIGIYEIVPPDLLSVFDYQELELLMCGVQQLDVGDWRRHTEYLGEYQRQGDSHRVIQWFWQAVEKLGPEEHIRLLQFVTGCSRLPAQGFKALQSSDGNYRKFNIHSVSKHDSMYPRAHTCFNKMDLPLYTSYDELESFLSIVVNMDITGFTME